ncbi:MAG TPA: hypothetical protein VGJ93_09405 [Desulfuromonadaceae bacterium]|jgi:type IV secretory pathway VirB3-like protein
MKLRWPFQILLLCFLVLLFFYPTLRAEVCLVDDQVVLTDLFNSGLSSLKDIFLPQGEKGGYYRPFIGLSYYLDKVVWDLDVRSMHLDNILMHLINVLLLFCIMRLVIRNKEGIHGYLPLLAAVVFALHPIVTESVNWISGRTDLMAGNFVLASAVLLLMYRSSRLKRYLVAAIAAIVLGLFSKEASFGMIIATCFLLSAKNIRTDGIEEDGILLGNDSKSPYRISGLPFMLFVFAIITIEVLYVGNYWFALIGCVFYFVALLTVRREGKVMIRFNPKTMLLFLGCSSIMIAVYFALRRIAFKSDVGKIGQTLKLIFLDINYSISVFLGASGFYIKKFIFPLPLNFFILEVDPLYDMAGIFLLLFCLRLLTRLNLSAAFFIAGVCMFLPALPFAFGTIAWTGYAERYIYISTAFWIVSAVMYLDAHLQWQPLTTKVAVVAVTTLTLFLGWQSYARNLIWQKNVNLLKDTVAQSPKSKILREMYMYAFYLAGDIGEAKRQYAVANSLHSLNYDGIADLVMAGILTTEGKLDEALVLYEKAVKNSNDSSGVAIKRVIQHLTIMVGKEKNQNQQRILAAKLKSYKDTLSNLSNDPFVLYTLGQNALAAHDNQAALGYFIRANSAFAIHNPYKAFSAKLIDHLKQQ